MVQIALIGIGAGIAAALLFASIASGALISIVSFYLAPLPILIVALGWSHWVGLIAALVGTASLAAAFSSYLFLAFLLGIGLPAWWLSYLALLARPVATPAGARLEWYPVGRLVIWAAILSALIVVAVLLTLGGSEESVHSELRRGFEKMLRQRGTPLEIPTIPDRDRRLDALVSAAPPAAAVSITFIYVISLWLAGRIVKVSNRLRRPWPDLSEIRFPPYALALFAAAVVGTMLTNLAGIASGAFAASLAMAYAMLGFAVLHAVTRGMNTRGLVLTIAYAAAVLIWPVVILVAFLGLAESAFDIRNRFARKRGPPTLPT